MTLTGRSPFCRNQFDHALFAAYVVLLSVTVLALQKPNDAN